MQIGCVYMQGQNFEPYFHLHAQNQQVLLPANFVAVCKQGLITVYTTDTYFADPQYINYSETWYLEEGFLGIQIRAIALTSWDHLGKDWNFSIM